jgi:hypothetical protein
MRKHKVGDHLQVKLSGGRIVEATIKAIVETTEGVRLQVSFGEETARISTCGRSSDRCLRPFLH